MSGGGACGKWWWYAESGGGMQKYAWAPGQNWVKLCGKWRGGWSAAARGQMSGPVAGCPGRQMSGDSGGCPGAWIVAERDELHGKKGNSGAKFRRNRGWKLRERWGKARSTRCKADPWIKSNKTSSHQQNTKKLGIFLWGIFKLGTKPTKQG